MILKLLVITLLIASTIASSNKEPARKVEVKWNPGCDGNPICAETQNNSYVNVVYVKATGDKDVIHYLYSTFESFTVLVAKTDLTAKLSIHWNKLGEANSIQVSEGKVMNVAGYVIENIYEFEDKDGKADMNYTPNNASFWKTYPTATSSTGLKWEKFSDYPDSLGIFEGRLTNGTDNNSSANSIKFIIRNPGDNKRDKSLPHLLLNPESTSIDMIIDVPASFELSKFGAEFLYLSGGSDFMFSSKTTMDDEYTPGTFKLWNIQFKKSENETENFMQCKPIFYYYEPRALENSTLARSYNYVDNLPMPNGIASGLFANNSNVYGMNVSFGIEGGKKDAFFYSQTNYTVWSFSVGVGAAPKETMSFVVTLVIAIGFGLPAVIIIGGVLVMIIKKIRGGRRSEFEALD